MGFEPRNCGFRGNHSANCADQNWKVCQNKMYGKLSQYYFKTVVKCLVFFVVITNALVASIHKKIHSCLGGKSEAIKTSLSGEQPVMPRACLTRCFYCQSAISCCVFFMLTNKTNLDYDWQQNAYHKQSFGVDPIQQTSDPIQET